MEGIVSVQETVENNNLNENAMSTEENKHQEDMAAKEITNIASKTENKENAERIKNGDKEQGTNAEQEGRRMTHLRYFISKFVDKSSRLIKKSSIFKMAPRIYKKYPTEFNQIVEQMQSQMTKNMNDEIDKMLKDEGIVPLMNELDEIVNESSPNMGPTWRPSGNADNDLRAHVMPLKEKQKAQMQDILKQLQERQEKLSSIYTARLEGLDVQRQKINDQVKYFEELSEDCKSSLSSCIGDMKTVVIDGKV